MAVERDFEAAKIGAELRAEREKRNLSVRELARRVGVSASLISQIELDRVNPSVGTLWSIVTELGMKMSQVFGETPAGPEDVATPRREDRVVATPDKRRAIDLASGVRWERLTPHTDPDVEFLRVVYPVGAGSSPEHALVTHGGREYGYITSGTLGVQVGSDEYVLEPEASITFESSAPHRLWTIGDEPVHAIWVVIGRAADPRPEFGPTLRIVE